MEEYFAETLRLIVKEIDQNRKGHTIFETYAEGVMDGISIRKSLTQLGREGWKLTAVIATSPESDDGPFGIFEYTEPSGYSSGARS